MGKSLFSEIQFSSWNKIAPEKTFFKKVENIASIKRPNSDHTQFELSL